MSESARISGFAHLDVPPEKLGDGTNVRVRILENAEALALDMATSMLDAIETAHASGDDATLIVPVGPVDQFPILARLINERRVDCRDTMIINMDEYLTGDDEWVPEDHALSFRGFMTRSFYDRIQPALAPRPENRVFPDPRAPETLRSLIDARGGVDICYGGIGINGHMAFNEPPEPGETVSVDEFAARGTRVLDLSRETLTINSVTIGGEIGLVPRRAVTVGMAEILASRRLRFYCNRPWQRAVVRRVLRGPVAAACPASLMRRHRDAELVVTRFVSELPDVGLR